MAAQLGPFPGQLAMDGSGDLFVADSGNRRIRQVDVSGRMSTLAGGSAGEDIPAISANLSYPREVAVNAAGAVLIADCGDGQVRMVDPSGVITTYAVRAPAKTGSPRIEVGWQWA